MVRTCFSPGWDPLLVAVWPGMGNVALSAGYYLLAKLEMQLIAEYEARDLFDVDQVELKEGLRGPFSGLVQKERMKSDRRKSQVI